MNSGLSDTLELTDNVLSAEFRTEGDVPTRLSHYDVIRPLGEGGMGRVYLARDSRLGRHVALKLLSAEYLADTNRLERFQREARTASGLNHPHICTVFDIGNEGGQPFIVMELIEGETLRAVARRDSALGTLINLGAQVAQALAAAHTAGIVHRDIKPENVMVRRDGYVKVVDFGLARTIPDKSLINSADDQNVTQEGQLIGTIGYMAPEQAGGEPAGTETDVFALGVVLYELATGRHPFQSETKTGRLQAILVHHPVPPDRLIPAIPHGLSALIQQMLQKDRRLRPSAGDVSAALSEWTNSDRVRSGVIQCASKDRHTVGRQHELEEMSRILDVAEAGTAQFLCVTGEPGIGKTTLLNDFFQGLAASDQAVTVGRGCCSERLAGSEAYLPFLEILESLLQSDLAETVAQLMCAEATNWYRQVVPLVGNDSSFDRTLVAVRAASTAPEA